ncbi:hypothetical protein FRC10_000771 [Ceratobasidium sp. 414]|nr:hypothetical protein FRC10_000771 [Ceratobasidium sp. 414]
MQSPEAEGPGPESSTMPDEQVEPTSGKRKRDHGDVPASPPPQPAVRRLPSPSTLHSPAPRSHSQQPLHVPPLPTPTCRSTHSAPPPNVISGPDASGGSHGVLVSHSAIDYVTPPFSGHVLPELNMSRGFAQHVPAEAPSTDPRYLDTFESGSNQNQYVNTEDFGWLHHQYDLADEQPATEHPATVEPEDPWRRRVATGEFNQE